MDARLEGVAAMFGGVQLQAPRIRLAVGVDRHEWAVTTVARFVGALKRYGFWPVTPATRTTWSSLAERHVPRARKQAQADETDEPRTLVEWLVRSGELVVVDGAMDRAVERFRTRYARVVDRYAEQQAAQAASVIVASLERDPDVEEVFIGDRVMRELEDKLAAFIMMRAQKRR